MHGNKISDVKFTNFYLKQIYDAHETFIQEFNSFWFTMLIVWQKKSCDATLEKPNRYFFAFSDNILTLFIRTFITTPLEWSRQIINTRYSM